MQNWTSRSGRWREGSANNAKRWEGERWEGERWEGERWEGERVDQEETI